MYKVVIVKIFESAMIKIILWTFIVSIDVELAGFK
jgi:hypothetical protein